jgi:hypothetical protein
MIDIFQRSHAIGNNPTVGLLTPAETGTIASLSRSPVPTVTQQILDSCGCTSYVAPYPVAPPERSMLSDLFTIISGDPWGISSASASFTYLEGFTPPSAYCCDTEIEIMRGGQLCRQETKYVTIARAIETCLLNQQMACSKDGFMPLLTQESYESLNLGNILMRYIGWIAVNGLDDEGVLGLRNNPYIPTYTINLMLDQAARPREFVEKFAGVWGLVRGVTAGLTAAPISSGEWCLILGQRAQEFMMRTLDNSMATIAGILGGTCPNICDLPPGLSPGKINDFLIETSLDLLPGIEMYLIRKKALRIYANRFDENGNQTMDGGSFVHFCPPTNQNCLRPVKIGFIRTAGLLIPQENSVVRVRLN